MPVNTGFKGLAVRQTGTVLIFRAFLQTSGGALLGTGTTTLSLVEIQSDGTVKSYDFSDNTFKTTALTTPTLAMTHRPSNNAGTTTGYWTAALATLTGFTLGSVYAMLVNNSGASPTDRLQEFQYGSAEGDLTTVANGTGVAEIGADLRMTLGTASQGAPGYVAQDPAQTIPTNPTTNTVAESWFYTDQRVGRRGTAQGGGSTTITLDSGASTLDNLYTGYGIKITGGTGAGQFATITNYVGATRVATITRVGGTGGWTIVPDNTSVFLVDPFPLANLALVLGTSVQTSSVLDANVKQILGTNVTESASGRLAGGFIEFFNVASPTLNVASVNQTGDSFNTLGIAGAGLTALGDARIAHLNADITSRQLTFTTDTGVSFPLHFGVLGLTTDGKLSEVVTTDNATSITNPVTLDAGTLITLATIQAKTNTIPVNPAAVGSQMALQNGAITDAKITLPTEITGTPSTALQLLMWIAGCLGWRKFVKDDNSKTLIQYMADGTTVKTTSTYTSTGGVDSIGKSS